VGRINRLGVVHARRGVDHAALVFGAMGPTGEAPLPEQSAAFHEQAEALAEGNAHGLVIETMTSLEESRLALEAALSTGLPVVVTLTPGYGKSPDTLTSGEPVIQALKEMLDMGAAHVGLNCIEPSRALTLCKKIGREIKTPLWVKPNAGRPLIVDGIPRYGVGPREFAQHGVELVKVGAAFVGGCCGVGPAHIVELSEALVLGEAA
jgi:5-methyltetrahydrofolate--homocysteine methyltransferase